jgi:hypothetical protein
MVNRRLPRNRNRVRHLCAVLIAFFAVWSIAPARAAETIECWRGWGYLSDPSTKTYTSDEMLLVTRGAADWRAGLPVELYRLDRATGTILADRPAMTVIPFNPRVYYRGRSNYVDGRATVLGIEHELVFGLNHVAPAAGGLEAMRDFNRWACGLAARE